MSGGLSPSDIQNSANLACIDCVVTSENTLRHLERTRNCPMIGSAAKLVMEAVIMKKTTEVVIAKKKVVAPHGYAYVESALPVAWLASEDCSFSTGAVFDISRGAQFIQHRDESSITCGQRLGAAPRTLSVSRHRRAHPQFQISPIGVWVQHGPKLPPL
jgi:hypothetical protein